MPLIFSTNSTQSASCLLSLQTLFSLICYTCFLLNLQIQRHASLHNQEDARPDQTLKDRIAHSNLLSASHTWLLMPERVYKLMPESDLTPIPGILKPQHHAADVEPDQS